MILSLKTFGPQVHSLLQTHEGTVPLLRWTNMSKPLWHDALVLLFIEYLPLCPHLSPCKYCGMFHPSVLSLLVKIYLKWAYLLSINFCAEFWKQTWVGYFPLCIEEMIVSAIIEVCTSAMRVCTSSDSCRFQNLREKSILRKFMEPHHWSSGRQYKGHCKTKLPYSLQYIKANE